MAKPNKPFYSCKSGRPETLKSHNTRSAAIKAAGEYGQIWDSEGRYQRRCHRASNDTWITEKPDFDLDIDLKAELIERGLIQPDDEGGQSE